MSWSSKSLASLSLSNKLMGWLLNHNSIVPATSALLRIDEGAEHEAPTPEGLALGRRQLVGC